MKRLFLCMAVVVVILGMAVPPAMAVAKPDFMNPNAVLADIKSKINACTKANAKDCLVQCKYAQTTLKNFLRLNPESDPSILEQRWQPCYEAHRDAGLGTATASVKMPKGGKFDHSRFVISGMQLGGPMQPHLKRVQLLEAYGYHRNTRQEHNDWILQQGNRKPPPDVIRNYKGLIREAPVYIHFEATGDGRIYMIQFEQKERMDVDQMKSALIGRFGPPTKHHGNYMYWGCKRPGFGFCVKANPSPHNLTIWGSDEDIKDAAYKAYDKQMLKAKGVKPGMKF